MFGVVGLNDWSARDVQAWEYVPLGPFLGKSFATSDQHTGSPRSPPWYAAWCDVPAQDPRTLPHLLRATSRAATQGLDIEVEVELNGEVVSRPPYRTTYWQPAQMLAHLTVQRRLAAHRRPVRLRDDQRTRARAARVVPRSSWWGERFLVDGAEVVLRYTAPSTGGARLSLGEVRGRVEPARAS